MSMNDDLEKWHETIFADCVDQATKIGLVKDLSKTAWCCLLDKRERALLANGLGERYPSQLLIPLFKRADTDDVICATASAYPANSYTVVLIHDYAESGWEVSGKWPSLEELAHDQSAWDW